MTTRLVILAPNWLGDAVMALPAIADVRRALPETTVAVAARASIAPLFQLAGVHEIAVIPDRWRTAGDLLRDGRFGVAILLPNSLGAAIAAKRARIPERWGYGADLRGPLLTRAIARPHGVHQVAYYQRLVQALGFPNTSSEPRITIPATSRDTAASLLNECGRNATKALAAIAPGAAFGGAKRWPAESFAALVDGLSDDGVQSVMVGATADRAAAESVLNAVSPSTRASLPPVDLVGRTSLAVLAAVLAECRALVTNDSGAMHVAAAAGIPVTAVFGPTNEHETRPLGAMHTVVASDAWCRPCMLRECPLDHQCMRSVDVPTVLSAARRHL
jgi:heptosyltransferase-2